MYFAHRFYRNVPPHYHFAVTGVATPAGSSPDARIGARILLLGPDDGVDALVRGDAVH